MIDLTDRRFGRLIVKRIAESTSGGSVRWWCNCDCGETVPVMASSLLRGRSKSCGCIKVEKFKAMLTKHGQHGQKTYRSWKAMKNRCYNPKHPHFKHYGGRGITVCDRWKNSFENFFADLGECPPDYSLERIDVNGNYEPSNCKWIPWKDQSKNRRKTKQSA